MRGVKYAVAESSGKRSAGTDTCCRQLEKTHPPPDRNDTRGGSGGSVEPPKQRSAAPAEAVTYRVFASLDPLRQQRARTLRHFVRRLRLVDVPLGCSVRPAAYTASCERHCSAAGPSMVPMPKTRALEPASLACSYKDGTLCVISFLRFASSGEKPEYA